METRPAVNTPEIEVAVLGPLEVRRQGRPQALPASRKTRALLGYLAVEAREHRRERLCDLLWDAPDDPRGALRWSLSRLRALFAVSNGADRQVLIADREKVALVCQHDVSLDLARVRELAGVRPAEAATSALRQAASAFSGDLLEGLELSGCPRFHAWLVGARAATRRLQGSILQALGGRPDVPAEEAVTHARALVALDPLDQNGHVALLRLLGRLGWMPEAREHHEACLRLLREAGLPPSAELVAAHLALSARTAAPAPHSVGPASPARARNAATSPFVGRAAELARARGMLQEAAAGHGPGLLLVGGEPGQGKSRFLAELEAEARTAGGLALRGRAFAAEMVRPYGAWIDAFRSTPPEAVTPAWRAALAPLLPELAEGGAQPRVERLQLFDALAGALEQLATRHAPLLLVLDDLHWCDEGSAALIHYLARQPRIGRLLLAAGVRPGELADNPPARRMLRGLSSAGRLEALTLGPLDAEQVGELAHALAPQVDAGEIFRASAGNPLFAIEVANALALGGDRLSARLEDLIGERLDRLAGTAAELVPWAAALGRGFSSELLGRVLERPAAEVMAGLDDLERAGIVRMAAPSRSGDYDFVHDLVREAAQRRLSAGRRQAAHRRLARALEADPDPEGALAGEIALHAALGGDPESAARACVRAGDRCLRLFSYREAAALADRGLAYTESLPAPVGLPLRVELMRLRVHPGLKPQRLAEIASELRQLSDSLAAAGMTEQVLACFRLIVRLEFYGGELEAVRRDSLQAASAARAGDPAAAARTLGAAAVCLAWLEKEMPRARAMLTEAQQLSREADIEVADIALGLGLVRVHEGDGQAALPLLERGQRLAMQAQDHWNAFASVLSLILLDLDEGRPGDAWRRCRDFEALAARFAEGSEGPVVAALEALCALESGDPGADARVEPAVAALRSHDHTRLLAYVLTALARRALAGGDAPRARALASEALDNAQRLGRRSELLMARLTMARVEQARGDGAAALAHLDWIRSDLARSGGASAAVRAAAASTLAELAKPAAPPSKNAK